jgi:hypothetical protein
MGASLLPATIYKNKLYLLFGKEREIDEHPGWSDFGGGTDKGETYIQTAIREGGEELTGFLGNDTDVKKMLTKYGTFDIDFTSNGHGIYRVHIFPMAYDQHLPHYYNNNQRFLQKKLSPKIIKDMKIFEKIQIKWICVDDLPKMKKEFREFYQNIVDLMLARKGEIDKFVRSSLKKNTIKGKSRIGGTKRKLNRGNRTRKHK